MANQVTIQGAKAIEEALSQIEIKTSKKILGDSLKEAVKPILEHARSLAPKRTGRTAAALKIFVSRRKKGVRAKVGTNAKAYGGDEFYAYFQEHGFHLGKRSRKKQRKKGFLGFLGKTEYAPDMRKWIEGKHFMERAFDSGWVKSMDVALNLVADKIQELKPTTMRIQVTIR